MSQGVTSKLMGFPPEKLPGEGAPKLSSFHAKEPTCLPRAELFSLAPLPHLDPLPFLHGVAQVVAQMQQI